MSTFANGLFFVILHITLVTAQMRARGSCERNITGETEGTISSPGYPNQYYPPNQNCMYTINAPENQVIVYSVDFMDMEQPDDQDKKCLYDFVNIYDSEVRTHSVCGKQVVYPNASATNQLRIHFVSDFGQQGQGFELKWNIMDPNERPIKLSCNFDDPMPLCAGWKNTNSEYLWYFTREHTLSAHTGPQFDHTTGNARGMYAYIEASGALRNITAILESPAVLSQRNADRRCIRLWYHMFGKGIGTLRIFQESNGERTLVAEYTGNKGDTWHESKSTITLRSLLTTISIEASRGMNYTSDIAIDDINITEGYCDGGGRSIDLPLPSFGGTPIRLPTDMFPQTCAANLESANCPEDCDLKCENFFNLAFSSCSRACYHKCACPDVLPIFHEGRCVDLSECPDEFTGVLGTSAVDTNVNAIATTQPVITTTADTTTTPDTTTTSNEQTTYQTERDLERKKEVIHDELLQQILQGIKSWFSSQEGD